MNPTKTPGKWKVKRVRVHIVFRVYTVIFGLLGLTLLIWGRAWFPTEPSSAGRLADATKVQVFALLFLASAACAGALAAVNDVQIQGRGLFWFGVGHVALWLVLVAELKFVWGWMPGGRPGPGDNMLAIVGVTAFGSFFLWLIAAGELPLGRLEWSGDLHPKRWRWPRLRRSPLRSQYEQKIRQGGCTGGAEPPSGTAICHGFHQAADFRDSDGGRHGAGSPGRQCERSR